MKEAAFLPSEIQPLPHQQTRKCGCGVNHYTMRRVPFQAGWQSNKKGRAELDQSIVNFLESRTKDIARSLRKSDAAYALAVERTALLYEQIDDILQSEQDLFISAGDCLNFREYGELMRQSDAILRRELYRQGVLDGIRLLSRAGAWT